jgi:hypothetical protein
MDFINDFIGQVSSWPLAVIVVICLNGLGLVLKKANFFPNRLIPLVLYVMGMLMWGFLGDVSKLAPGQAYPRIAMGIYGSVLGFFAWILHNYFLRYVEKYIPGFQPGDDSDDDAAPAPPTTTNKSSEQKESK